MLVLTFAFDTATDYSLRVTLFCTCKRLLRMYCKMDLL